MPILREDALNIKKRRRAAACRRLPPRTPTPTGKQATRSVSLEKNAKEKKADNLVQVDTELV